MRERAGYKLPEPLVAALLALGKALARGDAPAALLGEVLAGLAALPAGAAFQVDRRLVGLMSFYDAEIDSASVFSILGYLRPNRARDALARHPEVAPLFLFHRDGRLREAALDRLGEIASPFFLGALAWRLNDWAVEVRRAAKRAAERLLPRVPADIVARTVPSLLDRWRNWGRWENENLALFDRLFERGDVAEALAERFASEGSGNLGKQLRYALRSSGLDRALAGLAAEARHPGVRAVALTALLTGEGDWPFRATYRWVDTTRAISQPEPPVARRKLTVAHPAEPLILRGLRDRAATVRRIAADALIARRSSFPDIDAAAERLAGDRSFALRDRAEFLKRKLAEERAGQRAGEKEGLGGEATEHTGL